MKTRKRSGFTLIELLVVVSIIALLISILLPSLRRAREQAKAAACIANLKGVATASVVYSSDDPQGQAIPVHPAMIQNNRSRFEQLWMPPITFGGKSGNGRWDGNTNMFGTLNGFGPGTRPLNQSMYKTAFTDYAPPPWGNYQGADLLAKSESDADLNLDQFKCPSDTGYTAYHWTEWRDNNKPAYDFFGTSYTSQAFFITNGVWISSNSAYLRPHSRIPNPANTIYYMEMNGKNAWLVEPTPSHSCENQDESYAVIPGWHKRDYIFSTAFCDAHAEAVKIKGYEAPMLASYPGFSSSSQTSGHLHWRCVIVRGQGWQLDTLPAPSVNTGFPDDGD